MIKKLLALGFTKETIQDLIPAFLAGAGRGPFMARWDWGATAEAWRILQAGISVKHQKAYQREKKELDQDWCVFFDINQTHTDAKATP